MQAAIKIVSSAATELIQCLLNSLYIPWNEPQRSRKKNQTTSVSIIYPHYHIACKYFFYIYVTETQVVSHVSSHLILNMVHCRGLRDMPSMKHIIDLQLARLLFELSMFKFLHIHFKIQPHSQLRAHITCYFLFLPFHFAFYFSHKAYFLDIWSVNFGFCVLVTCQSAESWVSDTNSRVQDAKWRVLVSSNIDYIGCKLLA